MIRHKELIQLKEWFADYTATFTANNFNDQWNLDLKKKHTLGVCKDIVLIAQRIGLTGDDLFLAEALGLFHDIGRFEQYKRHQTFLDHKSENHAILGEEVLCSHNVLEHISPKARNIILFVVAHHNMLALPETAEKNLLYYTRLLRDADKLDIWQVAVDYFSPTDVAPKGVIELDVPDLPEISSGVVDDILNKRNVQFKHVKTLNDYKILQLGWVFDVNFDPTYEIFVERKFLEQLIGFLPQTDTVKSVYNLLKDHLLQQCSHLLLG